MAVDTPGHHARTSFELKSTHLPVVAVVLKSTDAAQLASDLAQRLVPYSNGLFKLEIGQLNSLLDDWLQDA